MNDPAHGSSRAGFTLLELMVVLVLISIMTAVILPEMRGTFEDALLRSTSRRLTSMCQMASSRAITLNLTHRVRIDLAERRCFLEQSATNRALGAFILAADVSNAEMPLDPRIKIEWRPGQTDPDETASNDGFNPADLFPAAETSPGTVAFYADGTADAAVLTLEDRAGFTLVLHVNPITSRVHVEPRTRPIP